MMTTLRRPTSLLATLILLGTLLSTTLGHATAASRPRASGTVTVSYPFTATVLQGPENGLALKGTLKLVIDRVSGYITGSLQRKTTLPVKVIGQLKGQMIVLQFHLSKGKDIFGTGAIGYDPDTKHTVMGGIFSGPSELSAGVWRVVIVGFTYDTGGCIRGIDAGNGSCIIIT
jgi:hypothetical protein